MGQRSMSNDMPEVDNDGFLISNRKWTHEIAEILARNDFKPLNSGKRGNNTMEPQSKKELPTGLTEDHWTVIASMRRFYLEWDVCPPIRMIARRTGMSLGRLKELFPDGLTKSACRYAGIPRIAIRPSFMYPR